MDKTAKVFEGRAMIAGNVCMNRMHGLVYPRFSLSAKTGPITQPTDIIEIKDGYSVPLNKEYVDTSLGALGINPVAAALRLNRNNNKNQNKSEGPTTEPEAPPTKPPVQNPTTTPDVVTVKPPVDIPPVNPNT